MQDAMKTDLSQLGASEGDMPGNTVQGTDALFQRQQALVDLSAFQPGLPVIVIRVCSTTTGQIAIACKTLEPFSLVYLSLSYFSQRDYKSAMLLLDQEWTLLTHHIT